MDKQQNKKSIELSLLLTFVITILIYVIGGNDYSYYTWGFAYWFVLGMYIVPTAVFVILLLILLYIFRDKLQHHINRFFLSNKFKRPFFISLITPFFLLFIFLYFRVKTLLYGDGYLIAENIWSLEHVFAEGKSYLEFLTLYLYYYIALILHEFAIKDGAIIISYLNSIAGVFSVYALWSIARILSVSTETKLFIFLSTLTSAVIILFFGYVEYYPWAFLFGFLGIRYILGYLKGTNSFLPMIFYSVLSVFFHFITIPVLVVSVYMLLYKNETFKMITHLNLKRLTLFILSGMFALYLIEQFTYGKIFVTVLTSADNNYLIYGWSHLLDMLNHLFLVAPLIICLFPIFLSKQGRSEFSGDIGFRVLYLITLIAFMMSFLIDPELGAARDWDLLSFYGIPCTILISYLIVNYFEKSKFPVWLNFALGIIVIVHIVPNIYEKNNPDKAVLFLDTILWEDPHYQPDYKKAERGLSWGYLLKSSEQRPDLAKKYFERNARSDDNNASPLYNLALIFIDSNQLDSARHYLKKGFFITPDDPKYFAKFSELESSQHNYSLAEKYANEALKIDSNYPPALTTMGIALSSQGKQEAYLYLSKAYRIKPKSFEHTVNLGIYFSQFVNIDSAYFYFTKSLPLSPVKQKEALYGNLISLALAKKQRDVAIEFFEDLKKEYPKSNLIAEKEKELGF